MTFEVFTFDICNKLHYEEQSKHRQNLVRQNL